MAARSSLVRTAGRAASRRASSASAAASSVRAFSQAAGDQPVFRVDRLVAAFGPGGLVAGLLDLAPVLLQGCVVALLELLGGLQAGLQGDRL